MTTVVSVRHCEHLTSASRIGVLIPVDDRRILLYIPTHTPVLRPGLTVQPHGTVGRPLPGKLVSTSEPRFLLKVEGEGRSVKAGPEGRGTLTRRGVVVSLGEFLVSRLQHDEYC